MKKKQEYEYAGECNGNNGNGCFMDSPGHDCGCFTKVPKEEPKQETLEEVAEKEFPLIDTEWCRTGACEEENLHLLGHRKSFIKGAKWQQEQNKDIYSEKEMINFAEFVATYTDKNRNVNGEMLHAKSKYDGAERTIDLLEKWFEQFKKK
jgi:hypothetical protein